MPLDLAILRSVEQCPSEELKKRVIGSVLVVGQGFKFAGAAAYLKQRLALGGFQLPHRLIGIGQSVRIIEMKRHRNSFFGVRKFAVAHVHARILVA